MASELGGRIGQLIRSRHGAVNSAAKAMGIPQRTLAAIVSGEIKNPRAELVTRVAQFHQVTTDWLLTGKGEGPEQRDPFRGIEEVLKWDDLVLRLKLPEEAHRAL